MDGTHHHGAVRQINTACSGGGAHWSGLLLKVDETSKRETRMPVPTKGRQPARVDYEFNAMARPICSWCSLRWRHGGMLR